MQWKQITPERIEWSKKAIMSTGSVMMPGDRVSAKPPKNDSETSKLLAAVKLQVEAFYFQPVTRTIQKDEPFVAFSHLLHALNYIIKLENGNADIQREQFKAFCLKHLPSYDVDALYLTFRNGYAHIGMPECQDGEKAIMLTNGCSERHLEEKNGVITLNAESLLSDLQKAFSEMCSIASQNSPAGKKLAKNISIAYTVGPKVHKD